MKATLDCLECFLRQSLRAARRATDDPETQRRIVDAVARQIPALDLDQSPAALSLAAYETVAELSGVPDPFAAVKRAQNRMALELEPELRELVRNSDDPLDAALHLAAAGNIIDLGILADEEIDIHTAVADAMRQRFATDHTGAFKDALDQCGGLLFLCDNTGEIVFDKILIEELVRHTSVTAVVKAGPILNDATREDAEMVGLDKVCEVIDNGGPFIGSPLELVPEWFVERMHQADIILGKGQGNYETIDDFPGDVYLILRSKCPVVAGHMGVELGRVAMISTRVRARAREAAPNMLA